MSFWRKKGNKKTEELIEIKEHYLDSFGEPTRVYKSNWFGETVSKLPEEEIINLTEDSIYILEFSPQQGRPVWTYVTLGMSNKQMLNGLSSELIWLTDVQTNDVLELMPGLVQYPFSYNTSYDYGQTISNSEAVSSFIMNVLLIAPPIIEAEDSSELLEVFESQNKELLWLLPIHNQEKEFIKETGDFTNLFDIWEEKEIDPEFLCQLNRSSTISK
ncbi:hypothetical protein CN383_11240 [Priestia megaterium]|uniref:suppressor of fused domain protein n=1 Tax=Priestia megaterium TaxID=1404 RepID=UPI000BF7D72E|nr:suppressor of fused domain protein [Priestia megaterium]PFB01872.1 hypothetical protein CN383_11240 [Priestia megaterium]